MTKRQKTSLINRMFAIVMVIFLLLGVFGYWQEVRSADLEFPSGSLIIPMDTTYQDMGMWKAYGLLYHLLSKGIPVSWAIEDVDTKTFDGVDFTASTTDLRTGTVLSSYGYKGGPFVIHRDFATQAIPIIQQWWATNANLPTVHRATAPFSANVDITLKSPPRIATEETNAGIAITYFNAAGIPDLNGKVWSTLSPNILSQQEIIDGALFETGTCSSRQFDLFVTPHNGGYTYSLTDPNNAGTKTYAQLDYFVHQGGGWVAMCHSILSNENAIADLYNNSAPDVRLMFKASVPGGFLTKTGFKAIANQGGVWTVERPELPLAQAVRNPLVQGLPGGSVQTWLRNSVAYHAQTELVAHFRSATGIISDWAVNGVAHDGSTLGKVTFLGGHSYDVKTPYSANMEAPYLRFFYNSLFFNGSAVAKMDVSLSSEKIPLGLETNMILTLKNTGSTTASNLRNAWLQLPVGVNYNGMQSGPTPTIETTPIGTKLSWSSLGNVEGSSVAWEVKLSVTASSLERKNIAHFHGEYGDVYGEAFTADYCRAVDVYTPASIRIEKSTSKEIPEFYPGQLVTWKIRYWNEGATPLVQGVIEDTLPPGFVFSESSITPKQINSLGNNQSQVVWAVGPLPAGMTAETAREITISAFAGTELTPGVDNLAVLSGSDMYGYVYTKSDTATVKIKKPPILLNKEVTPTGLISYDQGIPVLTYTLKPEYNGSNPLTQVLISDNIPQYTSYVSASANASGQYSFTPIPGVTGIDQQTFVTETDLTKITQVSTILNDSLVAIGESVTMTMTVVNNSGGTITNIVPVVYEKLDKAVVTNSTSIQSLNNGATGSMTVTFQLTEIGERTVFGFATGILADGSSYVFPRSTAPSILVLDRLNDEPANDLVTWRLGSNILEKKGIKITNGYTPGIYTLRGGNTKEFSKYNLQDQVWNDALLPGPTNEIEKGGSITSAGDGVFYVSEGNSKWFYKYVRPPIRATELETGTWTRLADASDNFNEGGATQYLEVGGVKYVYAVLGGSNRFRRYNVTNNTWTVMATTPQNIKRGGALTTDGRYLYALQGDTKTGFYRFDPSGGTGGIGAWSTLAPIPGNVGWGGSLTRIGNYIYAMQGNGTRAFWRYDITSNTWTVMTSTPGIISAGGSLTNDGTFVYALQGGTTNFYRFDPNGGTDGKGIWIQLAGANFTGNVGQGGAVAYDLGIPTTGYYTELDVDKSLLTSGSSLHVTLSIRSNTPEITTAPFLQISQDGGITWTTGTTPGTTTDGSIAGYNDPAIYQWDYIANATNSVKQLMFRYVDGTNKFPTTTSQSVIVSPVLTYQVRLDPLASIPNDVEKVVNVAMISDVVELGFGIESNNVFNTLSRPHMILEKSASKVDSLGMGEIMDYTLVLRNAGTADGVNLAITDLIPAPLMYVSDSAMVVSQPGSDTDLRTVGITPPVNGSNTVGFSIDRMKPGETFVVKFSVKVAPGTSAGQYTAVNQASVVEGVTGTVWSNETTHQVNLVADFQLLKTPDVAVANVGDTIQYKIDVLNTGDVRLSPIALMDPMLTLYPIVNPSTEKNIGDINGNEWIDAGEIWSYEGSYLVSDNDPNLIQTADGTFLHNTVTGNSTQLMESRTAESMVFILPEVMISKTNTPGSDGEVNPGDEVLYTLSITNQGAGKAVNLQVLDVLPLYATYVEGSSTIVMTPVGETVTATLQPNQVSYHIQELMPGEIMTISFKVRIDDTLATGRYELVNTATTHSFNTTEIFSNSVMNTIKAVTKVRIKKTVTAPEGSGYDPAVDGLQQTFTLRIYALDGTFLTDVVLKAGEVRDIELPYGHYMIREVAIPAEYDWYATHVSRIEADDSTTPLTPAEDGTYTFHLDDVEIHCTNVFEHVPYFHNSDIKLNPFTTP